MPAFKQKLARLAASSGVLACATAAFLAVGGVGASSALATCSTTIEGQGSSLQKIAQTVVFAPGWESEACGSGEGAKVNYVATSSGKGLAQWGYSGSGSVNTAISIIGTDDAPNATQIGNAKTAGKGANTVIVPVTQTAIAIVANPPSGCTLTQITNANLEAAFNGSATTWAAIGGTSSTGACSSSLTRVVRNEGSGTTYQFKNYLAKIHGWTESAGSTNETAICSKTTKKWSELEPIGEGEKPNTEWPECGSITVTRAAGGGAVAETVAKTPGTIGYAALPDAKAKSAQVLSVQDGGTGSKPLYAAPTTGTEGKEANCSNAKYAVPAEGQTTGTGLNVDWSQVFGGNPGIGAGYSICTLTYDLGWSSFEKAGFTAARGAQVRNYYGSILSKKLRGTPNYYSNLPTGAGVVANNVQAAAEYANSKIN